MLTKAKHNFEANYADVRRLLEIHAEMTGGQQGRYHNLEAVNKAAIISLCACWEVYIEDVCKEGIRQATSVLNTPDLLSKRLKTRIGQRILDQKNPLECWNLSGEMWKEVAVSTVDKLCDGIQGGLNTPKSEPVKLLIQVTFDIDDIIAEAWYWQKMSSDRARKKLDDLVSLRGSLAHGRFNENSLRKQTVSQYNAHVVNLVQKTNDYLSEKLSALASEGG